MPIKHLIQQEFQQVMMKMVHIKTYLNVILSLLMSQQSFHGCMHFQSQSFKTSSSAFIGCSCAPTANKFLLSLTLFMNYILSGRASSCLVLWQCGAPLTALLKKGEGVRLIAVGEVLCYLARCLGCLAICSSLPGVFCPKVKLKLVFLVVWGAIHITHHFISFHGTN